MSNNSNINQIPKRLLNECNFCNVKGLKPGILAVEFSQDIRTQEYFSSITAELELKDNGMCAECVSLTGGS